MPNGTQPQQPTQPTNPAQDAAKSIASQPPEYGLTTQLLSRIPILNLFAGAYVQSREMQRTKSVNDLTAMGSDPAQYETFNYLVNDSKYLKSRGIDKETAGFIRAKVNEQRAAYLGMQTAGQLLGSSKTPQEALSKGMQLGPPVAQPMVEALKTTQPYTTEEMKGKQAIALEEAKGKVQERIHQMDNQTKRAIQASHDATRKQVANIVASAKGGVADAKTAAQLAKTQQTLISSNYRTLDSFNAKIRSNPANLASQDMVQTVQGQLMENGSASLGTIVGSDPGLFKSEDFESGFEDAYSRAIESAKSHLGYVTTQKGYVKNVNKLEDIQSILNRLSKAKSLSDDDKALVQNLNQYLLELRDRAKNTAMLVWNSHRSVSAGGEKGPSILFDLGGSEREEPETPPSAE